MVSCNCGWSLWLWSGVIHCCWGGIQFSRSLLSSTDSGRNPAESGQFPEFRRNQIWQRGLPNWSNDSDGISNGIQIPLDWFLESPGRNEFPEFNGTESHHHTSNAQPCPNRTSVFADDQFGHGQQCQTLFISSYLLHDVTPTVTVRHLDQLL